MKAFTYNPKDYYTIKQPITSKRTGKQYKVKIKPYYGEYKKYINGSIVSLHTIGLFSKELLSRMFDNKNGKITISYLSSDKDTEFNYNMVDMTKLILKLHENINETETLSLEKIKNDYNEFEKWNGEV